VLVVQGVGHLGQLSLCITDFTSNPLLQTPVNFDAPSYCDSDMLITVVLWDEHVARV
jgi:hypothetical protein